MKTYRDMKCGYREHSKAPACGMLPAQHAVECNRSPRTILLGSASHGFVMSGQTSKSQDVEA